MACRGLCIRVVGKMSKDIGWESVKVLWCRSFLPCLVALWGFHPYVFSLFKMFFVTCLRYFWGGGYKMLLTPDTHVCNSGDNKTSVSRDSYGSRFTINNCKVMWARKVVGVYNSGGTDSI